MGEKDRRERGPSPSSLRGPPQSFPPHVPSTPPPLWPQGLQGAGSEDPIAPHALPVRGFSFWLTARRLTGPPHRRWAWLCGLTFWPGKLRGQLPRLSGSLRATCRVSGAVQARGPELGGGMDCPSLLGPPSPSTAVRESSTLPSQLLPQAGPRPGWEATAPCSFGYWEETGPVVGSP